MRIFLLLIFLLISSKGLTQFKNNELLWLGLGLKHKVTKKIRLDLEYQYRNEKKFSKFQTTFMELGFNYQLSSSWKLNANYRFMIWNSDSVYNIRHRYAVQAEYKKNFKNGFGIGFRERYQNDHKPDLVFIHNFRTLALFEYKINKMWKLFSGHEFFFALNQVNKFNKYRVSFGVNKKFTQKINLMLYYNYQIPIFSTTGTRTHIIAARAFYVITRSNKKEVQK